AHPTAPEDPDPSHTDSIDLTPSRSPPHRCPLPFLSSLFRPFHRWRPDRSGSTPTSSTTTSSERRPDSAPSRPPAPSVGPTPPPRKHSARSCPAPFPAPLGNRRLPCSATATRSRLARQLRPLLGTSTRQRQISCSARKQAFSSLTSLAALYTTRIMVLPGGWTQMIVYVWQVFGIQCMLSPSSCPLLLVVLALTSYKPTTLTSIASNHSQGLNFLLFAKRVLQTWRFC
ncbi:hypothetical protein EJB05_46225, partial [Eragrostis curvula]